jgi:D-alanyl-D-alanine carboxypeptidase/D-alanyl-D-alanine-endopeptidase (penicillin-binding protein 4)
VTGVSSLAGYVKGADGHQLAFVIINQNVLKLSRARAFQDKVCDILSR